MILRVFRANNITSSLTGDQWHRDLIDQSGEWLEFNTINWRDTTHFDSEDDYSTGCRNVSHRQQQQSYSGLRLPERSDSTYFWNDSWVQTFHSIQLLPHSKYCPRCTKNFQSTPLPTGGNFSDPSFAWSLFYLRLLKFLRNLCVNSLTIT